jgi:CubicO group peptidase (beta-lactamase class C family)
MVIQQCILSAAISLALVSTSTETAMPNNAQDSGAADFPRANPADVGIDEAALDRLHHEAEKSESDAVIIVKDGRLVADWDFGRERGPIEAKSVTKSVVNLAIGRLIDQGKIRSLDQPVMDFYPEWNQGRKKLITIRNLLNHTSGIETPVISGAIDNAPDCVQYALTAELVADPGSQFHYNNKAVNLLAGIVQRASGKRMDELIRDEIFEPLGIKDFGWNRDRAGNPYGMAGLQIRAIDLAKIGQLMLDEGECKGRRILSKEWVRKSVQPSQNLDPSCGLLWWIVRPVPGPRMVDEALVKFFKDHGMTARSVQNLEPLIGKPLDTNATWESLRAIIRNDEVLNKKLAELNKDLFKANQATGPVLGYTALGYLGQQLFVSPRQRLIGVRQRRARPGADREDPNRDIGRFPEMVAQLAPDRTK